jgi:hypothetical protein
MLPRRRLLQAPLLLAAERAGAASRKMTLSIHQFTSARAGYRKSLEGWARAGIREAEPTAGLLDDYLNRGSLASAKRILTDNGLEIVSGAVGVTGLWEPNPNFPTKSDRTTETPLYSSTFPIGDGLGNRTTRLASLFMAVAG